jgi:hypothetical protein
VAGLCSSIASIALFLQNGGHRNAGWARLEGRRASSRGDVEGRSRGSRSTLVTQLAQTRDGFAAYIELWRCRLTKQR